VIGRQYLNIVRIAEVAGEMAQTRTNVYHIPHVHLHNYIPVHHYICLDHCRNHSIYLIGLGLLCLSWRVTKICRLSWLTNTALLYEPNCGGKFAGYQPISTALHNAHGAQILQLHI
jgi:hypothetical protein